MKTSTGPFLIRKGSPVSPVDTPLLLSDTVDITEAYGSSDDQYLARDMMREAVELLKLDDSEGIAGEMLALEGEAEQLLYSLGFYVEWNDGYVIHRDNT